MEASGFQWIVIIDRRNSAIWHQTGEAARRGDAVVLCRQIIIGIRNARDILFSPEQLFEHAYPRSAENVVW